MASIRSTPLQLAASLGSESARAALSAEERQELDDAFAVLLSRSNLLYADDRFDLGPPRLWPYTLEAAMRMALAVYREFLPDWMACFREQRRQIPDNVPELLAGQIVTILTHWIVQPSAFSWDEWHELYSFIAYTVLLDGYLTMDFPETPRLVATYCYGLPHEIDIQNCQPSAGPMLQDYNPQGIHGGGMPDAIGVFLNDGFEESRLRRAIQAEVIPWCLGEFDPLKLDTRSLAEARSHLNQNR